MNELNKKWFQIVWACLLLAHVVLSYIQRISEAQWAHNEALNMLNEVLSWIVVPLTIFLFVWQCFGYWRQGERLFWRKWARWGQAIAAGVALAALLVLLVRYFRGENATLDEENKTLLLGIFSVAALVWAVARYKYKHWQKDDDINKM